MLYGVWSNICKKTPQKLKFLLWFWRLQDVNPADIFWFLTKMEINLQTPSQPDLISRYLKFRKNDINKWMIPWGQKNCIEFPLWKHRIEKVLHTYLNLNFAVSYDAITYFCLFYCNEVSRLCLKNKKKTLVQYVL